MRKSLRRMAVLGAVSATMLGVHASPAAAAGWDLTGGVVTISQGIFLEEQFDLANPEPDECTNQLPDASINVQFTPPSGVTVDFDSSGRTSAFGNYYEAIIEGDGAGTYTGSGPYAIDIDMDFTVTFYEITDPPECERGDVVCEYHVEDVNFVGTYTGSIPTPGTGNSVVLDTSAPGEVVADPCSDFVLGLFDGGDVVVDNLTAVYV